MLIGKRCVGVGLPDDPNRVCATFLVKTDVIARPVRKLVVAIRTPYGVSFSIVVGADASVRPSALGTIAAA